MKILKEVTIVNEGVLQLPIIPNGLGWKSTEKENLLIIESGEHKVMLSKIIALVDNSKEFICLQSFLFQDSELINSLLRAVQRSVKIFVLSSAEARLKDRIEYEPDFIAGEYKKLLDTKFKDNFVHRTASNFHAKYILTDPKTNPKGFICTNNFTENGFTKNPELAVELNKEQCEELFKVFACHFWEHSTDEQATTNEFDKVKPANKFILPKLYHIFLTSPNTEHNTLNEILLDTVKKAEKSISFSTFQIDKNTNLIKAILDKAKQGVEVTLFCRPIEKQFKEQLKELLEANIQIFFHSFMHAKSLLIDEKEGFIFTANFIENGLYKGLEVGIKLNEQQIVAINKIHINWSKDFQLKAVKSANIKDLKEIEIFENGKLTRKIFNEDNQEENKKISTISDLLSFFNQKIELKDAFIKSRKIKFIAQIDNLPKDIEIVGTDKFEILEGNKIIVIKNDFLVDDIEKIEQWKDFRLFYCS